MVLDIRPAAEGDIAGVALGSATFGQIAHLWDDIASLPPDSEQLI